jgi:hypothetical protein
MDGLLSNGLVERIETDRYAEGRITAAGRALLHELRDGDHSKALTVAIGPARSATPGWLRSLPAVRANPLAFRSEGTAAAPA